MYCFGVINDDDDVVMIVLCKPGAGVSIAVA